MKPQHKLHIANALMVLGLVPLLIGSYWMFSTLATTDYHQQSQVGGAFLVIGKVIFAYVLALIISGASAVWSAVVEKHNAGIRVRAAGMIRTLVLIMLVVPLALATLARL
jgi:phosphoglycerol transferase MdoB-like AlkP superfamily enzyme